MGWTGWRSLPPVLNERFYNYNFVDQRMAGFSYMDYDNRAVSYVDGSEVLPIVDSSIVPTSDSWSEEYSSHGITNISDAVPGGGNSYYTNTNALPDHRGFLTGQSASSKLLSGGSIGGMWVMGEYQRHAWVLDMEQSLKTPTTPYDDPQYWDALDVEYESEGEFIDAKFVIYNATIMGYAWKENVDPGARFFDETSPDTPDPFLLDEVAPWLMCDIIDLPGETWAGSRRHEYGEFYPLGHAIRPLEQTRDDSGIGTVLTSFRAPNSGDPYETRWVEYFYSNEGYWYDIPDYESPLYTSLKDEYSLVIAAVPRSFGLGSVPMPARDPFQTFASGYHPGSQYYVSLSNYRGTTTYGEYLDSYIGWVVSYRPPRYRLKMPTDPPMRQRHRDDGLTTDARQEKGDGSSQQSSIRQGGRVYY